MNIVPLSPSTIVRAPGWPVDHTSALKPAGSLILATGSLSAAAAIGGVGCGLRLVSCLLAAGFDLSSGLKPGGAWAAADQAKRPANVPASSRLRRIERLVVMNILPGLEVLRRTPGRSG